MILHKVRYTREVLVPDVIAAREGETRELPEYLGLQVVGDGYAELVEIIMPPPPPPEIVDEEDTELIVEEPDEPA